MSGFFHSVSRSLHAVRGGYDLDAMLLPRNVIRKTLAQPNLILNDHQIHADLSPLT